MRLLVTRRNVLLLLAAVVLVPTVLLASGTQPGRLFSRCVHSCKVIRIDCEDRCAADCTALSGNDPAALDECLSECHGLCVGLDNDCKDICLASKGGVPSEP